ncbi:MAG: hypothetical protein ABSF23_04250 [Terracidiphilus sp.]|jgi:hypothetical protein
MDQKLSETEPLKPPPDSLDRELLKFLREESDANRRALREDSDANRDKPLGTLRIIAYPITVALLIAGFLGWRSIADVKQSIQDEAQQETKSEITRMQEEIRKKLTDQFETPQLQKMVKDAAENQTQSVLRPLIVQEVSTDVAKSVKGEQHTINSTLVSETHKAVDQLSPTIDGIVSPRVNATVDKAVDDKIATQIGPILASLQSNQEISTLILRAQAGDGGAFDQLVQIASNPNAERGLRPSALQVVRYIVAQHNTGLYSTRSFIQPRTDEEMVQLLRDSDPGTRQAALDSLPLPAGRGHIDEIVQIMTTDPGLNVRVAGFRRFNEARGASSPQDQIQNLDDYTALQ